MSMQLLDFSYVSFARLTREAGMRMPLSSWTRASPALTSICRTEMGGPPVGSSSIIAATALTYT